MEYDFGEGLLKTDNKKVSSQSEFGFGEDLINNPVDTPIQVNLPTIVKTPDSFAQDVYGSMPQLGLDPITQGMMSQPEGGWNEFGVPISKGKNILPSLIQGEELRTDTGKPSLIEQAINKVAGIFGEEYHRKLSPAAKAQATVQLMAKEAGVPLSLYRQSPEFLEQAAGSFINMASLGLVPAFRESLTGEISFPATSTSGYIGGALGSLAGLFTTPTLMAGKVLAPVISNLPKVTAEAPIVYRMLTESLRDAAILGPAMGLAQTGEALKSTTFSDAATNIWHGVKSGAITGALFGTTRGLLPGSDMIQTATRISAGLVGLNAQRAIETGGNPFINRPVGEVIFDTLLDVAFLAKGMPKGEFVKLANDIDNVVKKKVDIEQKQELVNNILDEDLKRAQEKVLEVKKVQDDLEMAETMKKVTYDQMIKEDLSSKGRKIEQIRQSKKYVADEVINKAMEKLPDEEFVTIKKPLKEDVTFIGMQEGINGESFPLVNDKNKSTITYDPEKHNIVNKEDFVKESHGIEMEPITDIDLLTGTKEPLELSTERSPFRESAERTLQMKEMYEANADKINKDVEMATSKLINDVNRWLDGDETIPINEVRNQLSTFASRGEELKGLFTNKYKFDTWKKTVEEAAKWARNSDRLKNKQSGIKLTMGIDPKDIAEMGRKLKPFYSKLEEVVKQKLGGKVEVEQMKKMLENSGVSKDEIKNLVGNLSGKVSKQDVLDEIKSNMTEFEDVVLEDIPKGKMFETSDGEIFATENEAIRWARDRNAEGGTVTYDELRPKNSVQFESYVEPGAVSGSYREMFVTAPKASEGKVPTQIEVDNAYERYSNSLDKTGKSEDTHKLYLDWDNLRKQREDRPLRWQDGHFQYSDIQNPIVRIRYNERDVNGKRILFIEEFQGPSKDNQSKMPDYLQKRIYDIGVKRAIALAKEQGFDEIAWTTGEMQVNRYDLIKHIDSITYFKNSDGTYDIAGKVKDGRGLEFPKNINKEDLPGMVSEELTQKILSDEYTQEKGIVGLREGGSFTGLDLKIGGEGLRKLYGDENGLYRNANGDIVSDANGKPIKATIPSLMKKYGKGEVKDIEIPKLPVRERELNIFTDDEGPVYNEYRPEVRMTIPMMDITPKTPSTFSLYSGFPIDEAYKSIIELARKGAEGVKKAKKMKEFDIKEATKLFRKGFTTSFIERSGNTRRELSKTDAGYYAMSNMYMARGGHPKALQVFGQMRREVDSGLSRAEIDIKDSLIKFIRILDIAKYKSAKQFSFPEDSTPEIAAAYVNLFKYKKANGIRDLTPNEAYRLYHINEDGSIGGRVGVYFDTMKRAVKDLYEEGMITEQEYNDLTKHNYRKIRLVDIFDNEHSVKLGGKKITVYDSGIERLAKGKKTDIYEPDSNIVGLETLNTIYSRIYKNRANKELYELALNDKENPFARVKESKKDKIPEDFRNHYVKVYLDGEKKTIFLSNNIGPEWITSNAQTTFKYAQFLRYASASPLVKTFATGINQAFALRNLPRDALQVWFTARVLRPEPSKIFGRFESVYSPTIPAAMYQMGKHYRKVFIDAALKKGSYIDYIDDGGGMELLTPQGRLLFHGKHLEKSTEAFYKYAGYLGTTSELLSRLAIRDKVINTRAREKGKTFEEENKDKKSRKEATFAARDYMDFSQGGDIIKAMDNAIPYLSAKIVAMRGFLRAWKDQPVVSAYKLTQFAALVTGLYIGNQLIHPQTMKELEGDRRTIGNLVFPLGDMFGFKDETGSNRYPFIVIPINQEMAFFKALSEAGIDFATGKEVNVDRIVQAFKSISPADITSLPPTVSGALGYTMNKDFWMGKDIVSRGKEPFEYSLPKWLVGGKGTSENEWDKNTSQAAIDLGKATGLSPKRLEYLMGQLITNDNMYAQILGKAYKEAFGQLPQKHRDFILTEALSKVPIIKAFFKLTNPYSKYADSIQEARDKATIDRAIENNFLDMQVDAYLHGGKVNRSEIENYMRSFKDKKTYDRLKDRFEFQEKTAKLPNHEFWLGLKSIDDIEARAKEYVKWAEKDPESIIVGYNYIKNRGGLGIITGDFIKAVEKVKSTPRP